MKKLPARNCPTADSCQSTAVPLPLRSRVAPQRCPLPSRHDKGTTQKRCCQGLGVKKVKNQRFISIIKAVKAVAPIYI